MRDSEGVGSSVFRYRCRGTRNAVVRAEKWSLRAAEASNSACRIRFAGYFELRILTGSIVPFEGNLDSTQ